MPTRLSVWGLMIAVGLIGVLLGAFRFHFSVGSFLTGVIAIAAIRTSEKLGQLRLRECPIRERDRVGLFARSLVIASILLTTCLLPGLFVFMDLIPSFLPRGCRGSINDPAIVVLSLALLGWPISFVMRQLLW